jgi:hypothetical protein
MLSAVSYGRKIFYRPEGIAADFCPICRRASIVEVRQIRSQAHVNHIGVGQGEVVGRLVHCRQCASEWALRPGTIQTSINPTTPVSLETLLAETYPRFAIVNEERLQQEAAVVKDPSSLDAGTRLSLIAEPFFVLDNDIRRREAGGSATTTVPGLGCMGCAVLGLAAGAAFFGGGGGPLIGVILLAAMVGLAWLSIVFYRRSYDGYMRKYIYPRLAWSLAPLRPSPEEITQAVAQIRSQSKCASNLKMAQFLPSLEQRNDAMRAGGPAANR